MHIWPAIDLRHGKAVRLRQGDYDRMTTFSDDPAEVAESFIRKGARHLHVVDLDAAKDGSSANGEAIRQIVAAVRRIHPDVQVQLGGGVRDEATIERLLDLGICRLVIGTKAMTDPDWLAAMATQYPHKLVVGLDAKDGLVATHGWIESSGRDVLDAARAVDRLPLAGIVYTDISRDGMMQGANVEAMRAMCEAVSTPVVASGGVTTIEDVHALAAVGLDGCIVGRALYEGAIELEEALRVGRDPDAALPASYDAERQASPPSA
jgi:phosphoribosylformimino-5-aminoimidazole carboxamide ribotide isomerase